MMASRLITTMSVAFLLFLSASAKKETEEEKAARLNLEAEVFKETLAAGRGERDTVGVRDQWSSSEHLHRKEDTRAGAPRLSAKVTRALSDYGLKCQDCTQEQAVAKINAFVKAKKREAAREVAESGRSKFWKVIMKVFDWMKFAFLGLFAIVLLGLGTVALQVLRKPHLADAIPVIGPFFGDLFWFLQKGPGKKRPVRDTSRADHLRAKREEVARAQEAASQQKDGEKQAPTWRDNEEKEVWSTKQEKAYQKAVSEFQGVSGKEKWNLVAARVDGKSRQECLMHHKLLSARAAEAEGEAEGSGGSGGGTRRRKR